MDHRNGVLHAAAVLAAMLTSPVIGWAASPTARSEALPPPQRFPGNAGRAAGAGAQAGPAALTLAQLEALAQSHNPLLQRDLARVESARGRAVQAGLCPNPRFDTNNPEVFAGRDSTFNVGFMQEVVVKGKLRLDTAAADQLTHQAELTFQQNRLALLTAVRRQYYAVLIAQRRVQVLTELLEVMRAALETGRQLEKAAQASRIDTLLLQTDFQRGQASLTQARTQLAGERKQLAAVVGLADVETAALLGDLYASRPDFAEEVVRCYAVETSTLVQAARSAITRNEILLRRAQAEPYPNITVGPAYQFGVRPGNDQFWLTVTFPIPLWDRNQGNIHAAAADVRDAQASLHTLQNEQLQRVAEVLERYEAARQLAEHYEREILPGVRETLRLAQEGYARGVFDFSRYLQTQRTVVETNVSYLEALESVWKSAVDVAGLLQLEHFP